MIAFAAGFYFSGKNGGGGHPLHAVAFLLYITSLMFAPVGNGSGSDCYIEWDGRSNPVVCD